MLSGLVPQPAPRAADQEMGEPAARARLPGGHRWGPPASSRTALAPREHPHAGGLSLPGCTVILQMPQFPFPCPLLVLQPQEKPQDQAASLPIQWFLYRACQNKWRVLKNAFCFPFHGHAYLWARLLQPSHLPPSISGAGSSPDSRGRTASVHRVTRTGRLHLRSLDPPGAHTIAPGLGIPWALPAAQLGKVRPALPLPACSCPQQAGPSPPRDAGLCVGTAAIPSPFSPPLEPGVCPAGCWLALHAERGAARHCNQLFTSAALQPPTGSARGPRSPGNRRWAWGRAAAARGRRGSRPG